MIDSAVAGAKLGLHAGYQAVVGHEDANKKFYRIECVNRTHVD